jgi:rRNA maturation protein Nop10
MSQMPPMNLDLTNALDVRCERPECGNYTFEEVVLMKKISALVSPTGKEAIVPIPTFACNVCGHINKQFLPVKFERQEEQEAPLTSEARPSLRLER